MFLNLLYLLTMKKILLLSLATLILAAPTGAAKKAKQSTPERPSVCIWNFDHMLTVKKELQKGSSEYQPAYDKLIKDADKLLTEKVISITDKTDEVTAPTGDKRDFMSVGAYSWPNPDTPDGMPWIRKDGHRNPNAKRYDADARMIPSAKAMITLSLAYFFSGDERYAGQVAKYASTWFVNPETRMNPNLTYAAVHPGIPQGPQGLGFYMGVIQGWQFEHFMASISLIQNSKSYNKTIDEGVKQWCREMYEWMVTDPKGLAEGRKRDNHGTSYQLQLLSYATFTGDKEKILAVGEEVRKLIDKQVKPDGSQPHELRRPFGYTYTSLNLGFLLDICEMIRPYDPDLFSYTSPEGGSIGKALDFAASFLGKSVEDFKPYRETHNWEGVQRKVLWLSRAASDFDKSGHYAEIFEKYKNLVSANASINVNYLTY